MNTPTNTTKGFISLGLVFGLGMLGLSIAATTLIFSVGSLTKNAHALSGVRTLSVADSAVHEGVYQILNGATLYTGGTYPLLNYTSNSTIATSGVWPIYTVTGQAGNARGTVRRAQYTVDVFPSGGVFDHAIYSQNQLFITGSADVVGNVFANTGIHLNNSAATVDGNASSNGTILDPHGKITGTIDGSVETLLPPTINIDPYRTHAMNHALSAERYFTDPTQARNHIRNNTNYNQIVYVANGSGAALDIQGNPSTRFSGILVVEGDLSLRQGTYSADVVDSFDEPLVIYVGGDLTLLGNVEINGIVYVMGASSFSGGTNTINGSLISASPLTDVTVTGSVEVNYVPAYGSMWEDISGLDTTSGSSPRVSGWHEL